MLLIDNEGAGKAAIRDEDVGDVRERASRSKGNSENRKKRDD